MLGIIAAVPALHMRTAFARLGPRLATLTLACASLRGSRAMSGSQIEALMLKLVAIVKAEPSARAASGLDPPRSPPACGPRPGPRPP